MATLVLGLAGQAIGGALLPGLSLFGGALTGASLGGAIGALAGGRVDALIAGPRRIEGPRLKELHVQASTPGAPIPRLWGAMRIAGQVIWAARFKESETVGRSGGKLGPRVETVERSYSASFAVGLCEGVIGGVGRVWADGKPLDVEGVVMRVHRGAEGQAPDPAIEAIEGEAPAYRGLAYVVFEDLPLGPFGNRVPQLSFEVMRGPDADRRALRNAARGVCLIPGSGEFVYADRIVTRDLERGRTAAESMNNRTGLPDMRASLDLLEAQLPNVERVSLVVAWFGDDLRASVCRLRPGVERRIKSTRPIVWRVNGVERADAHLVSQDAGGPLYGGTPADAAVVDAIRTLKARGKKVTFYPFILMDVPPGNGLPNPYAGGAGQPPFPWRGRITCHPASGRPGSPDKTPAAAAQIAAFFGTAAPSNFAVAGEDVTWTGGEDWGLRRMILHYAHLCAAAGGVDAFLIGTEMRGLTWVRSAVGVYPAVQAFRSLAAAVRGILGPATKISYAADWSEYFGHQPADGSGDVAFHLDPLWADPNVDAVAIDNYLPLSDWRDGEAHLDAAVARGPHDPAYLEGNVEGGELYDWYYANEADRAAQARTPITDGAYGEPWVFRPKDLRGWWSSAHHDRPAGVRSASPTSWIPRSKPIWLTELGCPAVDKGSNQPNVFYDPKSAESALPYFSTGARDDLIQRRHLEATLAVWGDASRNPASPLYDGRMVDLDHVCLWCWDARPFPDFPLRTEVWRDGDLWALGHWLNGRAARAPLAEIVEEICRRAGLPDADASALDGGCDGYLVDRVMSAREALEPLMAAYGFHAAESGGIDFFRPDMQDSGKALTADDLAEPEEGESAGYALERADDATRPRAVKVAFADVASDWRPSQAEARVAAASTVRIVETSAPLALDEAQARAVAERLLHQAWTGRETARFALPPSRIALEPGDRVELRVDGAPRAFRLTRVAQAGRALIEGVRASDPPEERAATAAGSALPPPPLVFGPPLAAFLDVPGIAAGGEGDGVFAAFFAEPWPGAIDVRASTSAAAEAEQVLRETRRAVMGVTLTALPAGAPHRWQAASVDVRLYGGSVRSATAREVLDGANAMFVETAPGVWEALQFREAVLVAPETWRLSNFLRGQHGTEDAIASILEPGARLVRFERPPERIAAIAGETLGLRYGPAVKPFDDPSWDQVEIALAGRGRRPWRPAHLRASRSASGDVELRWTRRSRTSEAWTAGEPPLGEESEAYLVEILAGAAVIRRIASLEPRAAYAAADQIADWGALPAAIEARVAQVSPVFGPGFWARTVLAL